ncbi:hypothetical protein F4777DRAFT_553167 [Nemania sp. FL0916]|nr:hypothetical protein F4777DRAFT_553167 [Nemania sp. FL0916]
MRSYKSHLASQRSSPSSSYSFFFSSSATGLANPPTPTYHTPPVLAMCQMPTMRTALFASLMFCTGTVLAAPQIPLPEPVPSPLPLPIPHPPSSPSVSTNPLETPFGTNIRGEGESTMIKNIGYGQQIQRNDLQNKWVVWVEGKHACPPLQVLDLLVDDPCGQPFGVPGAENLTFEECGEDGEPNALHHNGSFIRLCSHHKKKHINCHHGEHDIIKHGKCVAPYSGPR